MGRHSYSNKTELDDLEKVDTKRLKNAVPIINRQTVGSVQLDYYDRWQERRVKQCVQLTTTTCYYGGLRYWFICPLKCGKRVGVLYIHNNKFGCRQCHNLIYRSKNMGRNSLLRLVTISYKLFLLRQPKRLRYAGKLTKKYKKWEKYIGKAEMRIHSITKK